MTVCCQLWLQSSAGSTRLGVCDGSCGWLALDVGCHLGAQLGLLIAPHGVDLSTWLEFLTTWSLGSQGLEEKAAKPGKAMPVTVWHRFLHILLVKTVLGSSHTQEGIDVKK